MVKIISDSTCDLSPELIAKYDIDILPLHILLGEDEYEDGKNITPEQIYSWSDENKTTPKTSAPALTDAIELFKPYIEKVVKLYVFLFQAVCLHQGMLCVLLQRSWRRKIVLQ